MRINLHSDDFGASRSVNTNILAAWRAGALDGVSVIANGDALHEAATAVNADTNRKLRLVVHLNLSEGNSLADPARVNLLVNEYGQFRRGFVGIWILWHLSKRRSRLQLLRQVEVEWREQIRQVVKVFSPRPVNGVDGHIHVHMLPFLFPIAARLASEFALPEIRIAREDFHFSFRESLGIGFGINVIKHLLLNILAVPARRVSKEFSLLNPDALIGVLYSGRMTCETALAGIRVADRKQLNWVEILFHPGQASPDEGRRWSGKPALRKFYMHSHRKTEREALIKTKTRLLRSNMDSGPKID